MTRRPSMVAERRASEARRASGASPQLWAANSRNNSCSALQGPHGGVQGSPVAKSGGVQGSPAPKDSGSRGSSLRSITRFGQSIKRIVREVEEQNLVDETRDVLVNRFVLLSRASKLLNKAYMSALNCLVTLQNEYLDSKNIQNIFLRYSRLKGMIKCVGVAESSWPTTLPSQVRADSIQGYIERCAGTLVSEGGLEDDSRKKMEEGLIEKTSKEVSDSNSQLILSLHRLIKKYQAIRNIVKTLQKDYRDSKVYPIMPRYVLLREMVKNATHHPDYKEYCHEATVLQT